MTDHTVPPIGMRMIKTAAAVLICLLVSMAVDREDMRIYSSIAALLCVQPYAEDTRRMAVQRTVGTAIGSVFGIATLLLEMVLDIRGTLTGYILIAAVTVPALWISVALKAANAAALSGIVFLSITVTHVTDASPWIFAWYRASETLVGIVVGIAVNAFQLPRRKRRDTLFVSGLDGLLPFLPEGFKIQVIPTSVDPFTLMTSAPGGFFVFGVMMAAATWLTTRPKKEKKPAETVEGGNA